MNAESISPFLHPVHLRGTGHERENIAQPFSEHVAVAIILFTGFFFLFVIALLVLLQDLLLCGSHAAAPIGESAVGSRFKIQQRP